MRTHLDCYACLVRHAIEAARLTSADTDRQEELVQHVLRRVAAVTPPHTPARLPSTVCLSRRSEPLRRLTSPLSCGGRLF